MNDANFGESKMEQPIDYEAKFAEAKTVVRKAMDAQMPRPDPDHVYNPEPWHKINGFVNDLKSKYGNDYFKYFITHALGGSSMKPEDQEKTFEELKAEGTMIDFDFPGEDSVETFLKNLDFKDEK